MSDAEKVEFEFGFSDESKDVMVVFIPLKALADDEDGTAIVRGKLDEVKAMALMEIQQKRAKKMASGVITPNGFKPHAVV